ncbi:MAG: DUF4132 domain-containing protein [Bacillota bacterium]|nr:DUF4132 domain-containing protein [Bacillota bacterium]
MVKEFIKFLGSLGITENSLENIQQFIETGDENALPDNLPSIKLSDYKLVNYEKRAALFKVVDNIEAEDEKGKRIFNVILKIGGNSFFNCAYNEYYSLYKVAVCTQGCIPGEHLITWIMDQTKSSSDDMLDILEYVLSYDREALCKAYEKLTEDYSKVLLLLFALKNNFNLSKEQKQLLDNICTSEGIKDFNTTRLKILSVFLYYAHEKREEFKLLISEIVNKIFNVIFDELVRYISNSNSKITEYDLVVDLNLPRPFYAAWLVKSYEFRKENTKILKEIKLRVQEDPKSFRAALEVDWVKEAKKDRDYFIKFHISHLIFKFTGTSEDLLVLRDMSLNFLGSYLVAWIKRSPEAEVENWRELWEYLNGEKTFEAIEHHVIRLREVQDPTYVDYNYKELFSRLFTVEELKGISFRFLNLLIQGEKYRIATGFITAVIQGNSTNYTEVMEFLQKGGVSAESIIILADLSLADRYSGHEEGVKEFILHYANYEQVSLMNMIPEVEAATREIVLEGLFNAAREKYIDTLIEYMGDSSKSVRTKVTELLSQNEENKDKIFSSLKARKAAARESAATILSSFDMVDYKDELQEILSSEKNEKVKNLIMNILNVEEIKNIEFQNSNDVKNYCLEKLKGSKASLPAWIDIKAMPEVSFNSGEAAGAEVMKYLLVRYASENTITKNEEAEKIFKHMKKQDLDSFANELLNLWIQEGAEAKKKWVLSFAAACGDFNVVNTLKKQIELWPQVSRGAIACEAVKALALLGSNEALIIIDSIARKFKFKQVKKAAGEAFQFAAEALKVDYEELADKIVPDLGFNKSGERLVDYGTRKFTVLLERDFSLKISDEKGKSYKSLPKPNKSDDEGLAKEAQEEFKIIKKQLKTVVSAQNTRLELALSVNRMWTKSSWEKLFVENPIMHNFSLGLIWGIYSEGRLGETFRYMEDGTFNTKEEEEFEIPEGVMIGLVHPLELEEADLEAWKTQLEDYEIEQPFLQLSRPVYNLAEEEANMKWIERFGGKVIYGLSLVGKLTKLGWYKGSIQDGGSYYQLYKENKILGLGAEISFDALGIGWEDHDTTIYEVVFYKAGTVERGSYVYDEVTDKNMIIPLKVPKRFFSEILYDVDRALESSTSFNKSWKKSSYRK